MIMLLEVSQPLFPRIFLPPSSSLRPKSIEKASDNRKQQTETDEPRRREKASHKLPQPEKSLTTPSRDYGKQNTTCAPATLK